MNFTSLPPEILTKCFSYLHGIDLSKVSQTCKVLHELSTSDLLWQEKCRREYSLRSNADWGCSYKEIYQTVLHKYGCLLGVWRNTTDCYGGLIHIWYVEDGYILGREYYGQKDVRKGLLCKSLFQIRMDAGQTCVTEWVGSYHGIRPCEIILDRIHSDNEFSVKWHPDSDQDPLVGIKEKHKFREECDLRGTEAMLVLPRFRGYLRSQFNQTFAKLCLPGLTQGEVAEQVPLPPGLFKGMYGGHGTEIILFTFDLESRKAKGLKISGDSNVPAGEISIDVDLSKPMFLTREHQESLQTLAALEPENLEIANDDEARPARQPFIVPFEVVHDVNVEYPNYCKHRFHSLGTVSPTGYSYPTKVKNHFIVFDDDTVGVLWLTLHSFSLFSRVMETFETLDN